ncbi:MAG: Abi family protein [Deltaproteobacteria bacterium]|nr:Abi family protein [Deltaproteobacteria bacterium]
MPHKPTRTIAEQLQLLKDRGMLFRDEDKALSQLQNISYYRLKGYWWDMQIDRINHTFNDNTYFEDVVERYNFDRQLRLILFDAIERIEIALRTKLIYHLSLSYGSTWYKREELFVDSDKHFEHVEQLEREFGYSQEIFIKDHKRRYPNENPEAWKILEIASMGTLSKFYKNLDHQLPEKAQIANEMGLNLHSELSSWLESVTYIRNIIAHHSRLWSRNMVKRPVDTLNNPTDVWFDRPLVDVQKKKAFLIISIMVFLCDHVFPENGIKDKILNLIANYPNVPVYKIGFLNNWDQAPIWK